MQRDQVPQDPDGSGQIHATHLTLTQGTAQKHYATQTATFLILLFLETAHIP